MVRTDTLPTLVSDIHLHYIINKQMAMVMPVLPSSK
jgi:hypothetical protein